MSRPARTTASNRPSGEYPHTDPRPRGVRYSGGRLVENVRSHKVTEPSLPPLANQRPSDDTSIVQISLPWPRSVRISWRVSKFHNRTVRSAPPEASVLPS